MNSVKTAIDNDLFREGYQRAESLLQECASPSGFLASPTDQWNYRRIWGRDGVILGLAALLTGQETLIKTFRTTLETLARYQGPHGEIPSNIDPETGRISYGGMAGRVDNDLLFIMGVGEYWEQTADDDFLRRIKPAVDRVHYLLGAWEYNNRGLLYVPQTGDWADEYLHHGYVLFDQLLYLQAQRTYARIQQVLQGSPDIETLNKISRLKAHIRANYWFRDGDEVPEHVYHKILYQKGKNAAQSCEGKYWMPFFSPHGYGYRFDSLANILASLLGVASAEQCLEVDHYIERELVRDNMFLLPAFHPVIEPIDEDWKELKVMFSYTFKNRPYEFQNAGLWPMVTGFYVADLCRRHREEKAVPYLRSIHEANRLPMADQEWSFPEFVHGRNYTAGGTMKQGWSAAAAIIGHHVLQGKKLLSIRTSVE